MNKTLEKVAEELGISRQALSKWRRRAKKKKGAKAMRPVGVLNPETERVVNGMTPAQVDVIRGLREEAGQ